MEPMNETQASTLHPHLPWRLVPSLCLDVFLRRERNFPADCRAMRRALGQRVATRGVGNIPVSGPVVIVANHLQGPGLWIGWAAGVITDAVVRARHGGTVRWTISTRYDRETVDGAKKLVPLTHWGFDRVAHAWGMVAVDDRHPGAALRQIIPILEGGGVAGIFPEGAVQGDLGLHPVPAGTLRSIDFLARRAILLPVAASVSGGRLTVRFGPVSESASEAWQFIAGEVPVVKGKQV
jgi:1-acyl-sn-glycerol-3-phosphate acyltransferase